MATLLPTGKQQFLDANGNPLAGGSVYFYVPGTTTPKDTWQDSAQTILNTNPVILDARGQAVIYGTGSYRQIVKDSTGNLIWDQFSASGFENGVLAVNNLSDLASSAAARTNLGLGSAATKDIDTDGAFAANSDVRVPSQKAAGTYIAAKIREVVVSVKAFGAVGDGSTDDTAAVLAAIAYLKSVGGGTLFFPRGTNCKVTSTILVDGNGIRIVGESLASCSLFTTTANLTVLKFSGVMRCELISMLVYSNVMYTANPVMWMLNTVQCVVDRCWLQGGYGNLLISGTACSDNIVMRSTFTYSTGKEMLQINRQSSSGTCGAIHLYRNTFNQAYPVFVPSASNFKGSRANATSYSIGDVFIVGGYYYQCQSPGTSAGSQPAGFGSSWYGTAIVDGGSTWQLMGYSQYTGARIDSGTSYIRMRECDMTGPFAQCVIVDDSGSFGAPVDVAIEQCTAHGPVSIGAYIKAGYEIDIQSFNTFSPTGSVTSYGIFIDPSVQGALVRGSRVYGFVNGLYIAGSSVTATGNLIVGNTTGIRVQAGASKFSLVGNALGGITPRGSNTTGVVVEAGASDYYNIIGNTTFGATTAISDGGSGTHKTITGNN